MCKCFKGFKPCKCTLFVTVPCCPRRAAWFQICMPVADLERGVGGPPRCNPFFFSFFFLFNFNSTVHPTPQPPFTTPPWVSRGGCEWHYINVTLKKSYINDWKIIKIGRGPWETLFILRARLRFRYFAAAQTHTDLSFLGRFQLPSSLIDMIMFVFKCHKYFSVGLYSSLRLNLLLPGQIKRKLIRPSRAGWNNSVGRRLPMAALDL